MKNIENSNSWHSIFGWYHTGDFVVNDLHILKTGSLNQQREAFEKIKLEIEHQGGVSYLAPFLVKELIAIITQSNILIKNEIEQFLNELNKIIIENIAFFENHLIDKNKNGYDFLDLLNFCHKYSDDEDSILETEDMEGLLMANVITKNLIDTYQRNHSIFGKNK
ncbi:hypothetical protein QJU43_05830 [Pasteurella atlantica]|uniref:hypothetical protein n=1 Tax=Pasteurellaceae TaxID=712 RepID=UPI0027642380|nr:hypothetical protein [Pasteurella atlantica]MDP8033952.1 hypothetical protein [Pasteurella atlantica]MDP8035825.1 hypothetical protein [Pasteurella atlantica]MDP8037836.1 hypothetical protein [Pasteurella atlantica]MDP8048188.1 hypothetical protein [Pasteurella atlantica]MDP8050148.1 hypothetical protein [Pasteurella atlantica]